MSKKELDAAYYQELHDNHPAFQNNNWLLQDVDLLKSWPGRSVLELGCGNGRFLDIAASQWERVAGVDWARSPMIDGILVRHPHVRFEQADILAWSPVQPFDLVVSADFLEHLPPDRLPQALSRFHGFGRRHYHRVACYDDGHSHLSILTPAEWMALFEGASPGSYELLSCEARKGDSSKLVITIGCH